MPMVWLQFIVGREIFCNCLSIYLVPITLVFYTNRREPISLLYIDYQQRGASVFWMHFSGVFRLSLAPVLGRGLYALNVQLACQPTLSLGRMV